MFIWLSFICVSQVSHNRVTSASVSFTRFFSWSCLFKRPLIFNWMILRSFFFGFSTSVFTISQYLQSNTPNSMRRSYWELFKSRSNIITYVQVDRNKENNTQNHCTQSSNVKDDSFRFIWYRNYLVAGISLAKMTDN